MTPNPERTAIVAWLRERSDAEHDCGFGREATVLADVADEIECGDQDYFLELADAAINAIPAVGWQPIETAPKDRPILLYSPDTTDGRWCVGYWFFGDWAATEPCRGDPLNAAPTHWMPLPDAP